MTFDYTTLITDRTAADVSRVSALAAKGWDSLTAAEQAEWLGEMKGRYTATDLNRVGAALAALSARLCEAGYAAEVTARTDWTAADALRPADGAAILDALSTIRSQLAMLSTTPEVPETLAGLTYTVANDIEQILLDVDWLIGNMQDAWYYAGEVFAGEI